MLFARYLLACLALEGLVGVCFAQDKAPEQPATEALFAPSLRLPTRSDLGLSTPRPVKAVSAALGLGRQRLALVVGNGSVGTRPVLASAPRDTQAVAAALRAAGFVVMVREDLSAADLRASLAELRDRLQPGGLGFVYVTALAVQVDGQNLWLPREAPLDTPLDTSPSAALPPAQLAQRLAQVGVPVSEIVNALLGTPDSPRLLVLDAAYQHPALAGLPQTGLAEQKLPPGMVALFSTALGAAQTRPEPADLPAAPAASGARPAELAASRFARALVDTIATPRITGAEALRSTRRTLFDNSQGLVSPWLSGDNDSREELAESTLLDSLIPRTPEDLAREALKQASNRGGRSVGEQTVAEVLQQSAPAPSAGPRQGAQGGAGEPATTADAGNGRMTPQSAPQAPVASASSLRNAVGMAASAVGAIGAVAGVAGTAAAVAATTSGQAVMAVQTASAVAGAVGAVSSVASTAGSAAGGIVALASRLVSDGGAAAPAAAAIAATPPAATAAAATAAAAVAAAATNSLPAALPPAPTPGAARSQTPQAGNVAGRTPAQTAQTAQAATRPAASGVPAAPPLDGRTASNAGGGERPVYVPRTNPFGYAEGDTFTYRVTDTWKGEVTGSYTTAIEEVLGDGKLLANGAQTAMDAQGRITRQRSPDGTVSSFEPSQELWWSNPKRGDRRDVLFKETFQRADATKGQTEWKGSTTVGRPRRIDTPAGPFEALPIESSGWYHEALEGGARSSGQWSRTVWYSPKLGHPVAIDIQDADRVGKLLRRERVELMHAQTTRVAP